MIFMKNRDNEFFDQQKLDELVKNRDLDTLRDQMVRILACPCCLNGFKHCRKYLKVFSVEEIQQNALSGNSCCIDPVQFMGI